MHCGRDTQKEEMMARQEKLEEGMLLEKVFGLAGAYHHLAQPITVIRCSMRTFCVCHLEDCRTP